MGHKKKLDPSVKVFISKMRKLLAKKDNWVKGAWAQTSKGGYTTTDSSNASKFCLEGAVQRVVWDLSQNNFAMNDLQIKSVRVISQATRKLYPYRWKKTRSPMAFNDMKETTFTDVKNVLKEAAAIAKKKSL